MRSLSASITLDIPGYDPRTIIGQIDTQITLGTHNNMDMDGMSVGMEYGLEGSTLHVSDRARDSSAAVLL